MWPEGKKESRLGGRTSEELKSPVAFPLRWLPRDQQGAKSTRRRRKWRVCREEGVHRDGEIKKGGNEPAIRHGCIFPFLTLIAQICHRPKKRSKIGANK